MKSLSHTSISHNVKTSDRWSKEYWLTHYYEITILYYMICGIPWWHSLFKQDNVPWNTAKIVKEWFEWEFMVLIWPPNSPQLNPETTVHLQRSWRVHAPTGQSCFFSTKGLRQDYHVMADQYIVCISKYKHCEIVSLCCSFIGYSLRQWGDLVHSDRAQWLLLGFFFFLFLLNRHKQSGNDYWKGNLILLLKEKKGLFFLMDPFIHSIALYGLKGASSPNLTC